MMKAKASGISRQQMPNQLVISYLLVVQRYKKNPRQSLGFAQNIE